jgi:hypothetical protein
MNCSSGDWQQRCVNPIMLKSGDISCLISQPEVVGRAAVGAHLPAVPAPLRLSDCRCLSTVRSCQFKSMRLSPPLPL